MKLSKIATVLGLSASLALGTMSTSYAADKSSQLTDTQKQQVQKVVRDYLLSNPQILVEVSQKLQQQQQQAMKKMEQKAQKTIPKLAKDLLHNPSSPVEGNPKGDITLVEFYDPQCPHCKDMRPVIDGMMKKDPNLRVVFKVFPIFGANSVFAAKALLAAEKQNKFQAFNEGLLAASNPLTSDKVLTIARKAGLNVKQLQKDMDSQAIGSELKDNLALAQKLKLMGTPAFIVASTSDTENGKKTPFLIPGTTSEQVLSGLIKQVRSGDSDNNS